MRTNTFFLFVLLSLIKTNISFGQTVVINEIQSSNTTTIIDENGNYEDWIELYNNGTTGVNLSGYGLSDDPQHPFKWIFPNIVLNPKGYLLIWASGKNIAIAGSPLHTNFKLSSSGESISLTNSLGVTVDSIMAKAMISDISYGRSPNGTGGFIFFESCTPNAANSSVGYPEFLTPPTFSVNSGFFPQGFNLNLSAATGVTILYTLDGSEPDPNNLGGTTYSYKNQYPEQPGQATGPLYQNSFKTLQYTSPIPIQDRSPLPNKIASISSTYNYTPYYIPANPIFKGTVVRAKAIKPGSLSSATVTKSYFISPQGSSRFTLPVISLSTNENNLFDYNDGIYVAGVDFDNWRKANPNKVINYNEDANYTRSGVLTEKVANISYLINGSEVLNQDIGFRIHGGTTRAYQSKALTVKAKSQYGKNSMDYGFFGKTYYSSFSDLVLRNAGGDFNNMMFRDALNHELCKSLHCITEAYQPSIVFINGEYWGILNIREKTDESDYFKTVFNFKSNDLDFVQDNADPLVGDNTDYLNLTQYIQNNSLASDSNYNYIKTRLDPESFADYFIANIYFENTDWPGTNIQYWRKRTTGFIANAPYGHDGRWRWAIHDMDDTYGFASSNIALNTLALATASNGPSYPNPPWSTLILRKLLENNSFKNDFINRFADLMNTAFLPSRVTETINKMKTGIAPEMGEEISRCKEPSSLTQWNNDISFALNFASARPAYQRDHIRQQFGISSNINATLDVSNAAQGYIKMNTIDILPTTPGVPTNPYPWTGIYFNKIPVTVKAVPLPGYAFSYWSGASNSTSAEITLTPTTDFSLTAHFVPSSVNTTQEIIYYWLMDGTIKNNVPLTSINSTFQKGNNIGILNYQSCLAGYPFVSTDLANYRIADMERRNSPTSLNYFPEANQNKPYAVSGMEGIQITQPFQSGGLENNLVFSFSTLGYKNIKFDLAALDEGAATGITLEYSTNSGTPIWITSGLAKTSFPIFNTYQLIEADFTNIIAANNNPDFKIRLRFTGPNMTVNTYSDVALNNISVQGVPTLSNLSYNSPNVFTKGTTITDMTPTVYGSTPVSYSVTPNLPAGLTLNTITGVISGTPTEVSATKTYTVTALNPGGNASFDLVLTINDIPPSNLSYTSTNIFTKGTIVTNVNPTVSGGTVTNYSITPNLPAGLTLNPVTGIISGTPTQISLTKSYTITALNSGGNTSFTLVITINDIPPSNLSYSSPNLFTKGTVITNLTPTISGGTITNYSIAPNLPAGLNLNTSTGVISGIPTDISTAKTYTITALNSGGNTSFDLIIAINDALPSYLNYTSPNVFTKGSAISILSPTVSGSTAINYNVTPNLPTGLNLNSTTGVISGTPTEISVAKNYIVTASTSDGNISFNLIITVNDIPPSYLSYTSPNVFTKGTAISNLNPTASGGTITNYSISPNLPADLTLNSATGVISGTPTEVSATKTYTITASNSGGNTSFDLVITVNDIPPSYLSYTSPNVFTKNTAAANLNPTVSGGTVTNYSITPILPSGLTLNEVTGIISGTPTEVSAMKAYTVTALNSGGNTTFDLVITVNDNPPGNLSYPSPNVFTKDTVIPDLNPTVLEGAVVNYSIAPNLPAGLTLNTLSGSISGIPTEVSETKTYTVTAYNSGGNTSFDLVITVNDIPPSNLSYTSPNVFTKNISITDLTPTISGGTIIKYSVSQDLPVGLNLNADTGVISGTPTEVSAAKTYTVTALNSGGSTSFDLLITVQENLSIDNIDTKKIQIFPNPFSDIISVTGIDPGFSYKLFSIEGKLIKSKSNSGYSIDLSELSTGVYMLQLSFDDITTIKKIIKK